MRGLTLAFAIFLCIPAHAAPPRLPPIDECVADRGLAAFRSRLAKAAQAHDEKSLLAMLSPDVLINFGGDTGRAAFARQWEPSDPNSDLWPLLKRMLALGCARSDSARVIPSLAVQFDGEDEEVFEVMVVVKPGAALRETAASEAATVATLEWDVVRPVVTAGDLQTRVRLADGREGWLFDADLYSPLGYRMVVEKVGGHWMVTAFVAGD